jgi:integrase/recombinase XerD
MTYLVHDGVALSRVPEGPLATYIEPFARSLREQGYARYSMHWQVRLAACFSRWLQQQEVTARSITSDHPRRYLRYGARQVRLCLGDAAALRHLLDFLRHERLIPAETKVSTCPLTPAERCVQAYEQHLREARGLARATIINYVPFIRSFLKDRFGGGPSTLSHLCARDVVAFVQHQAPGLHPKRAKLLTSALRSFLQYGRYRGEVKLDLAAAVPVVAQWSMSSIPRAIGADQVRQLLASIGPEYGGGASRLRHPAPALTPRLTFK